MSQSLYLSVEFGAARTGLSTVGYALLNEDGSAYAARSTSGVAEVPTGIGTYAATVAGIPDSWTGYIVWDTGTTPNRSAAEEISTVAATSGGTSAGAASNNYVKAADTARLADSATIHVAAAITDSATLDDSDMSVKVLARVTDHAALADSVTIRIVTAAYQPHWT